MLRRNKFGLKIFLIIYLVVQATGLFAQVYDLSFEHLTIDDGLSQNSINCILQDKDGFLWIGTQEGLNKYCGQNGEFEIYKLDLNDTNSISDIWIYDIAQDLEENIWIATRYGLNRLNPHTREIKRYLNDPSDASSLGDNEVFGVFVDKSGSVWVKTSDALSILNPKTDKFRHFEHYKDYFNNVGTIRIPIFEDKYGVLWTGSVDGLYYFDKQLEQFVRYKYDYIDTTSISNNIVTSICEDHNGNLWIGTSNGLNKFIRKSKKFERIYSKQGVSNSILSNNIGALMEDFDGNLWVGTDHGLSIMNLQTRKVANYRTQASNPNGINNDEIISLFKGSSRVIWVGTNGGGFNKADLKKKKFNLYRSSNDENSLQLSNNVIASIFLENDSILWIGTYGDGVNVINRNTNSVLKYSVTSKPMSLVDNFVHSIIRDYKNNIWLGTRNGINIYLNDQQKFIQLQDYIPNCAKYLNLNQKRIYCLLEDSKKNIWIATERGLFMINTINQDIHIYRYTPNDTTCLCNDRVTSIVEDQEGLIWIATGAGLNCYNPETTKFRQFKSSLKSRNSLSHNALYSVFEDSEGFIWIGTAGSGVNKYDKKTNKFTYYTEKHGLPNGTIYEIEEDNNGNLWFSTGRGLAKLEKKINTITSYDTDDGLQSLEFNNGASFKSSKGELFFGGINGFNSFFPDLIHYNDNIPRMSLIAIEIINEDGKHKVYLDGKKEIELTYKDYMFTIHFAALEYTKPEKNNYSYMMENLDESWIDIGTQHQKTFSNLNAGEYIFKVKGSNNDLVWNENPVSIKIIITPPFWKSKWSYGLYILIVVLSVYLYIELRTSKLKEANVILREKQMAALEIAKQKEELTIKNKSIFDSINYAKRIQEAMMPSEYLFKKLFPESFIFYYPKDIVSGDFYWIAEKNNKIFVAAADCTGHGVPGAFMSIIGFDLLRNITKEQGIEDPAQILNLLNEGVAETFSRNTTQSAVKDGMDIALCVIEKSTWTLEFAGAMNPVIIIRDNKIISIRGNRFSVGMASEGAVVDRFESHHIPLKENDVLYIFSDGFPDQFGGPFGKKFKYSRFRQLLLTVHSLPMKKQKAFIEENLNNWKGELEQVDDILVIGIKVGKF